MPPLFPKKGQGGDQKPRVRRNDCALMCTDGHPAESRMHAIPSLHAGTQASLSLLTLVPTVTLLWYKI